MKSAMIRITRSRLRIGPAANNAMKPMILCTMRLRVYRQSFVLEDVQQGFSSGLRRLSRWLFAISDLYIPFASLFVWLFYVQYPIQCLVHPLNLQLFTDDQSNKSNTTSCRCHHQLKSDYIFIAKIVYIP